MFDGEVGSSAKRKVSLRGKSGREGSAKDTIDKAKKERVFRAVERKQNDSAIVLQSWYRGRSIAFRTRNRCRNDLISKLHDLRKVEDAVILARGENNLVVPPTILTRLIRQTVFAFEATVDPTIVAVVCERLLQAPMALENIRDAADKLCIRRLACICLFLVAERKSENSSLLEVLRQLCISDVVAKPVRTSVLQGLGYGEGMVIRCGPPHFELVKPKLLKYIAAATSIHLSFSSFLVLCNCGLELLHELGEDKIIAKQVSQILLPAEGLMQPENRLYTNLILPLFVHPWAKSVWSSALSLVDSSYVSNVGVIGGTHALVNVLKLHQMFRTGPQSPNNNMSRSNWECIPYLLHPNIFGLLAGKEKKRETGFDCSNSDSEFSDLEEEETLELRCIISQRLKSVMAMNSFSSNNDEECASLVTAALHSLTNPVEALQHLDALPSVSFAPGYVHKAAVLGYSVPEPMETTSLLDDGASLFICAVYGELVAWGDLAIDHQMSSRLIMHQHGRKHSVSEGGLLQSIRQMISVLAHARSENSLVSRLWWHLKNRWRVEMVISEDAYAATSVKEQDGRDRSSTKLERSTTGSPNGGGSSHTSQLVRALLLFCAAYHLQLVGLDDEDFFEKEVPLPIEEVCCVIEFLRNWLLKVCWKSPLLESDPPPSRVELRLFESAVGLYNALHDRWSRRPYAKPEIWNWPALNSVSLFLQVSDSDLSLHETESFYFGGSRPLPVILGNIPQVIPFNQRLLIFRELLERYRMYVARRERLSLLNAFRQPTQLDLDRRTIRINQRARSTMEAFFGTPDAALEPDDTVQPPAEPNVDETPVPEPELFDEGMHLEQLQQLSFTRPNPVQIRRTHLYQDSLKLLADTDMREHFQIQLVNKHGIVETGIDGGGVFKEWMDSFTKCAFSSDHGLWVETSEGLLFPDATTGLTRLDEYKFCGRVLGKAILAGIMVAPLFSFPFLNSLLYRQNYISELYTLDASIYRSLMGLKVYAADGNDVKDLCLSFSVDRPVQEEDTGNNQGKGGDAAAAPLNRYRMHTVDVIPGGRNIEVTNENVSFYIHCLGHFILNVECRHQCRAFISGFRDVLSANWICIFSPRELQRLIGGDSQSSLDVVDLMTNTEYGSGYHPSQPYIQAFWDFVQYLEPDDQAALLQFVTSCPRQPLLGFKELKPRFCIQKIELTIGRTGKTDERLPTSSTCYNLLRLPKYDNIETMRSKLLYAIHSKVGFELT